MAVRLLVAAQAECEAHDAAAAQRSLPLGSSSSGDPEPPDGTARLREVVLGYPRPVQELDERRGLLETAFARESIQRRCERAGPSSACVGSFQDSADDHEKGGEREAVMSERGTKKSEGALRPEVLQGACGWQGRPE
jgi:hypothetical protein